MREQLKHTHKYKKIYTVLLLTIWFWLYPVSSALSEALRSSPFAFINMCYTLLQHGKCWILLDWVPSSPHLQQDGQTTVCPCFIVFLSCAVAIAVFLGFFLKCTRFLKQYTSPCSNFCLLWKKLSVFLIFHNIIIQIIQLVWYSLKYNQEPKWYSCLATSWVRQDLHITPPLKLQLATDV